MINVADLTSFSEDLRLYDVVQEGWEQESNGFEANASLVLNYLDRDIDGRDFNDAETVQTVIAPDSLQYALRLIRWASVEPRNMSFRTHIGVSRLLPTVRHPQAESDASHFRTFTRATDLLAQSLDDLKDEQTHQTALKHRAEDMIAVSRLLIATAEIQSGEYNFDLVRAFNTRLSSLRASRGITHPTSTSKKKTSANI